MYAEIKVSSLVTATNVTRNFLIVRLLSEVGVGPIHYQPPIYTMNHKVTQVRSLD